MQEETAQIEQLLQQYIQAFIEGDVEALSAMYAEDAQLFEYLGPFRMDGRGAIQAFLAGIMRAFPARQPVLRQNSIRVYNGTTAAQTAYFELRLVDNKGQARVDHGRVSTTVVKQGEQWLIVNNHFSYLPAAR